jgi:hypothetical protein
MKRTSFGVPFLALASLVVLGGCDDARKTTAAPDAGVTTATKPSVSASASAAPIASAHPSAAPVESDPFAPGPGIADALDPNAWVKLIKAKPVTAKVGDKVWAAVLDTGGMAGLATRVTIQEVKALGPKGDSAALKDGRGSTVDNVSGGVITPRGDASKLKAGDLVLALNGANVLVAKLVKLDAGKPPRVKSWDEASGKVAEYDVDYVDPLLEGGGVLSWVTFQDDKGLRRGLVFAVEGDKVWVADLFGGWGLDKAKVKPWTIAKDAKVGDSVLLAGNGGAVFPAKVTKVETPQVAYVVEVTRAGKKETQNAFAGDLGTP